MWNKEQLTKPEALMALFEMVDGEEDQEHLQEVYSKIENDEEC